MKVLLQMLRWDVVMQMRYGFWIVAVLVVAPWIAGLLFVNDALARSLLPAAIFLDVSLTGVLFMAGVFFFEKREGTIFAMSVTPIHTFHWLASKVISLTAIVMGTCTALVLFSARFDLPWGRVIIACLCITALFVLIGFILAASKERFTDFFLYYVLAFGPLEVPALAFIGISHPLFWLLPSQPAVVLLRGAFGPMPLAEFATALAVQLAWIGVAFLVCLGAFQRFVADRRAG